MSKPPPSPETSPEASPAASPCIGVCQIDSRSVCFGCGRSLAEIAEWSQASEVRRIAINQLAASRRAELSSSPRS